MKTLGRLWVITVMIVAMIANDSIGLSHNDTATEVMSSESDLHQRSKRSLMFPYNSAQGIIVAIALPLGIPDRNIFLSYNFEGNYNNPIQSNVFTEGFFNVHSYNVMNRNKMHSAKSRKPTRFKRLVFTEDTQVGISGSLVTPVGNECKNVFNAFVVEMNYNVPIKANAYWKGWFGAIIGDLGIPLNSPAIFIHRSLDGDSEVVETPTTTEQIEGETISSEPTQHPEELINAFANRSPNFTRKKAYRAIERHLKRTGLDGKKCLLRAICEAAEMPLGEHNGIIGDIMHILLSPSSSVDEGLPPEFYKAEQLGEQGQCQKYRKRCDKSVLDEISFML